MIGTTTTAADGDGGNSAEMIPGKRLALDDPSVSLDMKVPTEEFALRFRDGTGRKFVKVDEERADIGSNLVDIIYDDETRTQKDLVPRQYVVFAG